MALHASGGNSCRARIAYTTEELKKIAEKPYKELGAVPYEKATNQRMTPYGISTFYGCLDRKTCLSEIRCITGDTVVSGAFSPLENLKLLNLNELQSMTDNTDPLTVDFSKRKHAIKFLQGLSTKLTLPKGNGNNELTYLSTQVLFEYFIKKFSDLDGIIYPSIQTASKGENIALFPERSVTAPANFNLPPRPDNPDDEIEWMLNLLSKFREVPKLKFKRNSLVYHKITSVTTESKDCTDILEMTIDPYILNR